MKKFLGIIVIAGALVACNNTGDSTTGADTLSTDSLNAAPVTPIDSVTTPVSDTLSTDSLKKSADSLK